MNTYFLKELALMVLAIAPITLISLGAWGLILGAAMVGCAGLVLRSMVLDEKEKETKRRANVSSLKGSAKRTQHHYNRY